VAIGFTSLSGRHILGRPEPAPNNDQDMPARVVASELRGMLKSGVMEELLKMVPVPMPWVMLPRLVVSRCTDMPGVPLIVDILAP